MPWFKVDDKLHDHRKTRKAGVAAMGLWALAGSWCSDNLTDGFVPRDILVRWEPRGAGKLAAKLVEADLWHADTVDGEDGWRFRNWSEFQPTRAEVEAQRGWQATRAALHRDEELVAAIRSRDCDRCRYCAVLVSWKARRGKNAATYDHVIPVSKGGGNSLENVVVACRTCNTSKGDRSPEEAGMTLLPPGSLSVTAYLDTNQIAPRSEPERSKTPTRPDPTRLSGGGLTTSTTSMTQPSPFCPRHPNGTDDPCGACGIARRAHLAWQKPTPMPPHISELRATGVIR